MLVFLGVGNLGGIKFFILFANMDTLSHTHVKNYAKCISYYINIYYIVNHRELPHYFNLTPKKFFDDSS